ncbi:hypothetical protein [Alicyclobacillus fodiniaquatilis]|uniref:Uncharacterized protein n=1 Tax=Alicyclobacillus fodiniaquatilis TaxID=1661150 RepID=A0ABW4JDI2_9BACL
MRSDEFALFPFRASSVVYFVTSWNRANVNQSAHREWRGNEVRALVSGQAL